MDQTRSRSTRINVCLASQRYTESHPSSLMDKISEVFSFLQLYYEKLPMYIQAILEMTLSAIQKESDAVARQAITFWTTVCDVEYDMLNSDEGEVKRFVCVC
jgi:hypothetical protein